MPPVPVVRLHAPEAAQAWDFEVSYTKTKSPSPAVVGHFAALWGSRRIAAKVPPDAAMSSMLLSGSSGPYSAYERQRQLRNANAQ